MVDNLKRFREPAGWTVLFLVVATLLLAGVRFVLALTVSGAPTTEAFQDAANSGMNLTMVVVLVAIVCLCLFIPPPTPNAERLARASAVVVTVGTLLTIIATVWGLTASAGTLGVILEALGGLLDVVLKGLAAVTLWTILRGTKRLKVPAEVLPPEPEPTGTETSPPTWNPTQAGGTAWRTAADAAAGSQPANLSKPGQAWGTSEGAAEAIGWRRPSAMHPDTPEKDEIS